MPEENKDSTPLVPHNKASLKETLLTYGGVYTGVWILFSVLVLIRRA